MMWSDFMKQLEERERGSNEETEIELEIGTEKKSERKRKNASKRIKEKNMRDIEESRIYRNVYSYANRREIIHKINRTWNGIW